jgi:hypothetical protein
LRIAYLALIEMACLVHTREIAEGLAALGHEVTDKRAGLTEAGLTYVRRQRTRRQAAVETADFITKRLAEAP